MEKWIKLLQPIATHHHILKSSTYQHCAKLKLTLLTPRSKPPKSDNSVAKWAKRSCFITYTTVNCKNRGRLTILFL